MEYMSPEQIQKCMNRSYVMKSNYYELANDEFNPQDLRRKSCQSNHCGIYQMTQTALLVNKTIRQELYLKDKEIKKWQNVLMKINISFQDRKSENSSPVLNKKGKIKSIVNSINEQRKTIIQKNLPINQLKTYLDSNQLETKKTLKLEEMHEEELQKEMQMQEELKIRESNYHSPKLKRDRKNLQNELKRMQSQQNKRHEHILEVVDNQTMLRNNLKCRPSVKNSHANHLKKSFEHKLDLLRLMKISDSQKLSYDDTLGVIKKNNGKVIDLIKQYKNEVKDRQISKFCMTQKTMNVIDFHKDKSRNLATMFKRINEMNEKAAIKRRNLYNLFDQIDQNYDMAHQLMQKKEQSDYEYRSKRFQIVKHRKYSDREIDSCYRYKKQLKQRLGKIKTEADISNNTIYQKSTIADNQQGQMSKKAKRMLSKFAQATYGTIHEKKIKSQSGCQRVNSRSNNKDLKSPYSNSNQYLNIEANSFKTLPNIHYKGNFKQNLTIVKTMEKI